MIRSASFVTAVLLLLAALLIPGASEARAEKKVPSAASAAAAMAPTAATAAANPGAPAKAAPATIKKKAKGKSKKKAPAIWLVIPFLLMLGCIAVLPLTAEHWWESNKNKFLIALALGIPVATYFAVTGADNRHELIHISGEYVAFMCLLGSLYVISGGILFRGHLTPSPAVNTGFLAVGAILASFMGTTGAAMLLIRPVITINSVRKDRVHTIIFFTFLVANIGGLLTPLGDPPLFMGYLRGVPFSWTFSLTPQWALMVTTLLVVYFVWDTVLWRKDDEARTKLEKITDPEPLSLRGLVNFPLLVGVICCVAFGAKLPMIKSLGIGMRELIMIGLAVASWKLTSMKLRRDNEYSFHPILEVAVLFFGIFLTMIPAVMLLKVRGAELGVTEPWQFFWATGMLSSFLDNTPTYVVFFSLAEVNPADVASGVSVVATTGGVVPEKILVAMSLGAVFMGANTYIGNGPNFMVKAIADERGVKMPSFFGYMAYAFLILVPIFAIYTFIWF